MGLLSGKVIISTLPSSSHEVLQNLLVPHDAVVLNIPMIEISPVPVTKEEKDILKKIEIFNWIVFTSKNGVSFFFDAIAESGIQFPDNLKTAVIGEKTGIELLNRIPAVNFISNTHCSKKFSKEIFNLIDPGDNVLLVLGQLAANDLETELTGVANVCRLNIYRTTKPERIDKKILQQIEDNRMDLLLFSSPSAFVNFIGELGLPNPDFKLVSIGNTTTQAMLDYGCEPLITATESSINGMANEIINYYLKIES
ncbi:MAG: uroporphyrinogen-III synthase [Bacteroidetes bacterium]|nr:uroporphyrinogen-III synthase [Bacteroidota bacterium]MBU1717858.1 uroporphyrinogen-III synthase [Bacteroidota bacterium]